MTFAVASSMHALGHAGLALAAGGCAQALAGGPGLLVSGSRFPGLHGAGSEAAIRLAAFGLAAVIVKSVGGVAGAHAQARLCGEVGAALRLEVLDGWLARHRLQRPGHGDQGDELARGDEMAPARAVAAMTARVHDVESGVAIGLLGGMRAVAQLVPLLAALVWLAPALAGAAALVFVPFGLVLGRSRKVWKRAHGRAARDADALVGAADEAVRHAELWTTFGAEARIRRHVAALGERVARHAAWVDASAAGLSGANEVLGALALLAALVAARAGWVPSPSSLLPFAVVFFLAYRPLRDLTEARLALTRAGAAVDALRYVTAPTRDGGAIAARVDGDRGAQDRPAWSLAPLVLEALTLGRGDADPMSLVIAPGSVVAIVGPTGAGKTTLLRVLLGLEAPASGHVRYGAQLLDGARPGPSHRPFAWVPQEAPILADTLAANVALGAAADAPDVLAMLGANDLAVALGEAPLGAGGRALSGGERQWVAIARAVATGQPVLLLDEPTSGLDSDAQARVLDAIERLRGKRTVLIVTHREEPIRLADRVLRLGATRARAEGRTGEGRSSAA